jgi:rare lipoprotein A
MKIRMIRIVIGMGALIALLQLSACSTVRGDGAPSGNIDASNIPDAVPKSEPLSKYGNPSSYVVRGKRIHVLKTANNYNKIGFASWYGTKFNGKLTSTRERYNLYSMTAASPDLPIPTYVRVTNLSNGKSCIVKVNDRGPFVANRIIDLSYVAAKKLGYAHHGTTLVRVTAINPTLWAQQQKAIPAAPSSEPSQFYLQVGAFANRENAHLYEQRIAQLTDLPVQVKPSEHNDSPIFRVQLGPLAADQSNEVREKLENAGLAPGIHVVS